MLANWSGDIPDGTVWGSAEVQRITGSVRVPAGAELTIQPGAIIKFNSSYNLIVDGSVDARGTPQQPIYFTSYRDDTIGGDTNGDGASTTASKGDWGRIEFASSGTGSTLDHVEISYGGGTGANGALTVDGGLTLTNSVVRDSLRRGVQLVTSAPTLTDVTFRNNGWAAIRADLASQPRIENAVFDKNATNGMELDSGSLPGNTVWDNPTVPYVLTGNLTVPTATSLTVAPGQIVAANSYSLTVNGTLTARGTAAQPIIFTSPSDNSLGVDIDNNPATTPARGNWPGIRLQSGSVANVLEHVDIRYAGTSTRTGAAVVAAGPLELRNSIIRDSYEGLRITGSTPVVTGTTFRNSNRAAITMDLGSDPAITDVALQNNGVNGLQLDSGNLVQSSRWDDPEVPYVLSGNVTVPVGMSLSVGAGQVVGSYTYALTVAGSLTALGTVAQPIVFTSTADNSVGVDLDNNPASTPARGNWPGIRLQNTSVDNVLEHMEIRYAGTSAPAAALITAGPLAMRDSLIRDSYLGVRIEASTPLLSGVSVVNSNGAALSADLASHPQITDLTLTNNGRNALVLDGGTLPGNATWGQSAVVYWLASKVTVPTGVTLLVAPGQIIALDGYAYGGELLVEGTLDAQGTADRPIIFTAPADNSLPVNIDNANYTPGRGYWRQIQFASTSTGSILDHCELRYGGGATPGTVFANGGPLTIRNSLIRDSWDGGLGVGNGATVYAHGNQIIRTGHSNDSAYQNHVTVSGGATLYAYNNTIDNGETAVVVDGATAILVNNLITNNTGYGIQAKSGATITASYNDVFHNSAGNYQGLADLTGTAGNVSADPLYFSQADGQYQLRARSPAVDAGTSDGASPTDFPGLPRFDDPHVLNRGAGAQPFVDLGAFERQETSGASPVDLQADSVSGPAAGLPDQAVQIVWTIGNVGTGAATGSWEDAVYLSVDTVWTPDDLRLGAAAHSGDVGPGQTYTGTANVVLPGVLPGSYYFLVRANWQNELYEGNALLNNAVASTATMAMDLPELTIGVARAGSLTKTGEAKTYKVQVAAGSDLTIRLTGPAAAAHELYVQHGAAPSRQSFDDRGIRPNSADQVVSVPSAQGGAYYVLVYGAKVPAGDTFTLTAELAEFAITSVTPAQGSRLGQASLAIAGAQFAPGATARLVDGGGNRRAASAVYFTDTGLLTATLDLRGLAPGAYDLQVENPGGQVGTAAGAFQVIEGVPGQLSARLIAPSAVRVGRNLEFLIEYSNTGDSDLLAPVLRVSSTDALPIRLTPDASGATSAQVIAVNPQGPAGILPPGQSGRVTLYGYAAAPGADSVDLFVGEYPDTPIDWATLGPTLRPADLSDAEWAPLLAEIQSLVGVTWADYHAALSDAVTRLPPNSGGSHSVTEAFLLIEDQARANLGPSASGRVTLADAHLPVVGADVLLVNVQTGEPFAARTFSDGTFLIPQIAAGTYVARVDGYDVVTAPEVVIGSSDADDLAVTVQPGAAISGYVVQAGTGAPLGELPVSAVADTGAAYSAMSTRDGRYTLPGLTPGTYRLAAGGGSYTTAVVADVVVTAGQVRPSVNLVLDVGATISGTVTGPAGAIEGARVAATAEDGLARGAVTSPTGQYMITGLAPGTFKLTVTAATAAPAERTGVVVSPGQALTGLDFVLPSAGALNVTTVDMAGTALPSVSVVVEGESATVVAVTDGDGIVQVTGLAPGDYTVTTMTDALMTTQSVATVLVDATTSIRVATAPRGAIRGAVTDAVTGVPVPSVLVTVGAGQTVTDAADTYQFTGLDAGGYLVALGGQTVPAVATAQVVLDSVHPTATADLTVRVAGRVSGTVRQQDGTPVADAAVQLVEAGTPLLSMRTTDLGHYSFVILSAGTYTLEAFATDAVFAPIGGVAVGGGVAETGLDFVAGSDVIRGTVQDRLTGLPLAGATVAILPTTPTWGSTSRLWLTTDATGQFRFPAAVPGEYRVEAIASGYAAELRSTTVEAGLASELVLQLGLPGSLHGRVRQAADSAPVPGATIQLIGLGAPDRVLAGYTDDTGAYEFSSLPLGTYTLVVSTSADHEAAILPQVGLAAGDVSLDVSLFAARSTVAGTVQSAAGPVAGAVVRATNAAGLVLGHTRAGADGAFLITGLPPDTYAIVAHAAGYRDSALAGISVADGQTLQGLVLMASALALVDPPASMPAPSTSPNQLVLSRQEFHLHPVNWEFQRRHVEPLSRLQAMPTCGGESALCVRARRTAAENLELAAIKWEDLANSHLEMMFAQGKYWADGDEGRPQAEALVKRVRELNDSHILLAGIAWQVDFDDLTVAGRVSAIDWERDQSRWEAATSALTLLQGRVKELQSHAQKPTTLRGDLADRVLDGPSWNICEETLQAIRSLPGTLGRMGTWFRDLITYERKLRSYLADVDRGLRYVHYLETYCVRDNSASAAAPPAPLASAGFRTPLCCTASAAESTGPTCRGRCPPPPPPSEQKVDSAQVQKSTSVDPNAKLGPAAFGPDGFLPPGLLVYEIQFENDPQAGATIPAQEVWITDTLDTDLDLTTVEFTGFGFNNLDFAVPAGLSHYETTLDLRPYELDLLVPVKLDVNASTRVLSAYFGSLDPATFQLPDALDAGFLPVNDKQLHNGEGYLRYQVLPQAGSASGTVIMNRADIKFDVNAIIPTPETKHTLDVGAPSSQVAALPSMSPTSFTVVWQGSDDAGGSGIAGFDVLVSTDGGPFLAWQTATANTSAVFVGQIGHNYRFYSIATDNVGHREADPGNPDAQTAVSGNHWHNAANRFDVSGSNDVTAQDVLLIINYINKHPGDQSLPAPPATPPPYYDVTDDGLCTANDALFVINEINRRVSKGGAGEAVGADLGASAVVATAAIPRSLGGDGLSVSPPWPGSAANLAVRHAHDRSVTPNGERERELSPFPVLAAGSDGEHAGVRAILAARRVWSPRALEELDAAFSLGDDLLPLSGLAGRDRVSG